MTFRDSVLTPPHWLGSMVLPTMCGHVLSHSFEQGPPTQSLTEQSSIFSGGDVVLDFITVFRTFVTAQTSVYRISSMRSLHSAILSLYIFCTSRCCCSFVDVSSTSVFLLLMAAFRASWHL